MLDSCHEVYSQNHEKGRLVSRVFAIVVYVET